MTSWKSAGYPADIHYPDCGFGRPLFGMKILDNYILLGSALVQLKPTLLTIKVGIRIRKNDFFFSYLSDFISDLEINRFR